MPDDFRHLRGRRKLARTPYPLSAGETALPLPPPAGETGRGKSVDAAGISPSGPGSGMPQALRQPRRDMAQRSDGGPRPSHHAVQRRPDEERPPLDIYDPDAAADRIVALEAEIGRLTAVNAAMVRQLNEGMEATSGALSLVERTISLETKVRERTEALERALAQIESSNRDLERAKTEAETAQARLVEAIEAISEGFVLYDTDDRLALCNSKYRTFWTGAADDIKPGITFRETAELAIRTKTVASAYLNPDEWLSKRLAHHQVPDEPFVLALSDGRWMQVSERRTRDGGTVAVYTDITEIKQFERRRRERELGETSALLQSTLDNLSQGVSVFDKDNRLVAWNGRFCQLLMLPRKDVHLGVTFEDIATAIETSGAFIHYNSLEPTNRWIAQSTSVVPFVGEFRRADGTIIEVRRNRMPHGGFVSTYTDVTAERRSAEALRESKMSLERRVRERTAELTTLNSTLVREISVRARIEEALRQAKADAEAANLSKTRFIAAASHDLLQPLNAARLFATALVETVQEPRQRGIVENLDQSLGSVEDLLNALLDISKIDSGVVSAERTDFRIDRLLTTLATEFAPLAAEKGIDLQVLPSGAAVNSDVRLLRRILQNFVSNAIRYTRRGRILVGCRRQANAVRVEVWDTGIGIPDDRLEEVFEEFKRLSNPEPAETCGFSGPSGRRGGRADNGLGLGLAIVQRIGRLLGHPIGLRSKLGHGSVFSITLPLALGPVAAPAANPRSHGGRSLTGTKILFIDNEVSVLEGMLALLETWSCETIAAIDRDEADEQLDALGIVPDVIIADYHLDNDRFGTEAAVHLIRKCRALRAGEASAPDVPGIIITADRSETVRNEIAALGLHLLNKPVKPAELRSLLTHLLPRAEDGNAR